MMACQPEEERITNNPNALLAFSNDTVIFDTLLTARTSVTKRFRIYNPNEGAVNIDRIKLGKGNSSDYSIIVNGQEGTTISDQVIFGGDSLLVLVDVTIDPQDENLPYLVKDSILVEWGKYYADIKLVSWGQDANFINGGLICDEVWTAERPYVIYNFAYVDTLCTLTLNPGTRVFMDTDASLFVQGSLKIQGDSGQQVLISNTRFDEDYQEAPGQWGGIFFFEASRDNEINYANIQNGQIGLAVGYSKNGPFDLSNKEIKTDLKISHVIIRHMSFAGIFGYNSKIIASNSLIYNTGSYLVGNFAGGNYKYEHCTFVNTPSFFINDDPMVQFSDNIIISEQETLTADLNVSVINSIIWGDAEEQIFISDGGEATVDTSFVNNIIKSGLPWPENFASQERNFPGFYDLSNFDYQLDSLAFARDKARASAIQTDLTGKLRDELPDIGAYERFDKE